MVKMMMGKDEELRSVKRLVGLFNEEVKTNSVMDFIVWVDCKLELMREREAARSPRR